MPATPMAASIRTSAARRRPPPWDTAKPNTTARPTPSAPQWAGRGRSPARSTANPAVAAGIRPVSTAPCTLLTWRKASAESRPKPRPTASATTAIRGSRARGGSSGWRRARSTTTARRAAGTARPAPTRTGPNARSAATVAGNVMLKHATPVAPRSSGDAFLDSTEVLLLSFMNNDSSTGQAAQAVIEDLVSSLPAGSKLPSYRDLQQRYRLSPATAPRLAADLARRGLVVTRPGSGTFTAARRAAARPADVGWQTLALGTRPSLDAGLEQLIEPPPPGSIGPGSGSPPEPPHPL